MNKSFILEHIDMCDKNIKEGGELYRTAENAEEQLAARDSINYWIEQRGYLISQLKTENDIQISEYDKIIKKQDALANILKVIPIGTFMGEFMRQNRFITAIRNESEGIVISRNTDKYI